MKANLKDEINKDYSKSVIFIMFNGPFKISADNYHAVDS